MQLKILSLLIFFFCQKCKVARIRIYIYIKLTSIIYYIYIIIYLYFLFICFFLSFFFLFISKRCKCPESGCMCASVGSQCDKVRRNGYMCVCVYKTTRSVYGTWKIFFSIFAPFVGSMFSVDYPEDESLFLEMKKKVVVFLNCISFFIKKSIFLCVCVDEFTIFSEEFCVQLTSKKSKTVLCQLKIHSEVKYRRAAEQSKKKKN